MTKLSSSLMSRELLEIWPTLNALERRKHFFILSRPAAEELFLLLETEGQIELLINLSDNEIRSWLRCMPPDDIADLIQQMPEDQREKILNLVDDHDKSDVVGLLAYAEDAAGGLMNPNYIRLRPDINVKEAIRYLKAQAKTKVETVYNAYVLDKEEYLLGVVSFRDLLLVPTDALVIEIMTKEFISVPEEMDSEELAVLFSRHSNLRAIPIVDVKGRMKGIVTYDDIASVIQKEATEDMHKLVGMKALDAAYFQVPCVEMAKKRVGWLTILF